MMILTSYAYAAQGERWQRFIDRVHGCTELMIDSGAFSVKNAGKTIELRDYIEWCVVNEPKLWGYVQLDVIRDRQATLDNLDKMSKAGLRPMPVLTADAPESLMPQFVAVNPRVCVAGGVDESSAYYAARIERAWRASEGKALIHGLGFTRGTEVAATRVRSVDSSSWNVGARYGILNLFDRVGGWQQFKIGQFKKIPFRDYPSKLKNYLINSGVSAATVAQREFFHGPGAFLAVATASAAIDFQVFCAGRGIRNFLAISAWHNLAILALAMHHRKGFANGVDWAGVRKDAPFVERTISGAHKDLDSFFDYFIDGVQHADIRCREDAVRGDASVGGSTGPRIVPAQRPPA